MRVSLVCVMRITADKHQLQLFDSIDFFCPCHSQPSHCPTRPARTPHAGHNMLQVSRVQLSLTGLSTGIEPIVSVTTMKLSRTCVCFELHVTAIDRHVLQASDDSTVESAFLCVQLSIIIKPLLDGSSYAWCRSRLTTCQSRDAQHHSEVIVGHNISTVVVQHSLTLEVFVPHTTPNTVNTLN